MQAWQKRVVEECSELDEKIKKLELFITNNTEFKRCNEFEQRRLRDQHQYMNLYSQILHSRIIHFGD